MNEIQDKHQYLEIPHNICSVCNDDGNCLNNKFHKDYEKNNKYFFGTDYIDCINYLEKKNNTRGQFMKRYIKNLQKEEKNKEPYESDFVKWLKEYSK